MLRAPSPNIKQDDPYGAETACIFQLLYMHGIYGDSEKEIAAFDILINWKRNHGDTGFRTLYQALANGFEVLELSTVDPAQLVGKDGPAYLRSIWQKDGMTEEEINRHLRRDFPLVKQRAIHKLTVISQFPQLYTHRKIDSQPHHATTLVDSGYQVGCTIETAHSSLYVLLTRPCDENDYELFSPAEGIRAVNKDELHKIIRPRIKAFRRT